MCVSVCEGGVKLDKKAVLVGVKSSPVGYVEIYIGVKFFFRVKLRTLSTALSIHHLCVYRFGRSRSVDFQ